MIKILNRKYCYDEEAGTGVDACDILLHHFPGDDWRSLVLRKEDFKNLTPWKIVELLNRAYDLGRSDAQHDIRTVLGVKE
jgi:hypothetical protein